MARDFVTKILSIQLPGKMQALQTERDFYTDHGIPHIERVVRRLGDLNGLLTEQLTEHECFLLLVAAYCHDLGMFWGRRKGEDPSQTRALHHERSAEIVSNLASKKHIDLDQFELPIVDMIVKAHRILDLNASPLQDEQRIAGDRIRTRLLAALLRIADACDIDHSRTPEAVFNFFENIFPPLSKERWNRHRIVADVQFDTTRASMVVSVNLSGAFIETIEKVRISNIVRKELEKERGSVYETLLRNGICLARIEVKDYQKGTYVQLSELPILDNYVLVEIVSNCNSIQQLYTPVQHFLTRDAGPVFIVEIAPPEGPLFIETRKNFKPVSLVEVEKVIRQNMGNRVLQFTGSISPKAVI